jgi:hypothetical protein
VAPNGACPSQTTPFLPGVRHTPRRPGTWTGRRTLPESDKPLAMSYGWRRTHDVICLVKVRPGPAWGGRENQATLVSAVRGCGCNSQRTYLVTRPLASFKTKPLRAYRLPAASAFKGAQ